MKARLRAPPLHANQATNELSAFIVLLVGSGGLFHAPATSQVFDSTEDAALDRLRLVLTVTQAGIIEAVNPGALKTVFGFAPQVGPWCLRTPMAWGWWSEHRPDARVQQLGWCCRAAFKFPEHALLTLLEAAMPQACGRYRPRHPTLATSRVPLAPALHPKASPHHPDTMLPTHSTFTPALEAPSPLLLPPAPPLVPPWRQHP